MLVKYTPELLSKARKQPMIKKWRASGRNGTLISNPTLKEMKNRATYQKACAQYIRTMLRLIIQKEIEIDEDLDLKPEEYYFKRYDLTAVECSILRNEILN